MVFTFLIRPACMKFPIGMYKISLRCKMALGSDFAMCWWQPVYISCWQHCWQSLALAQRGRVVFSLLFTHFTQSRADYAVQLLHLVRFRFSVQFSESFEQCNNLLHSACAQRQRRASKNPASVRRIATSRYANRSRNAA